MTTLLKLATIAVAATMALAPIPARADILTTSAGNALTHCFAIHARDGGDGDALVRSLMDSCVWQVGALMAECKAESLSLQECSNDIYFLIIEGVAANQAAPVHANDFATSVPGYDAYALCLTLHANKGEDPISHCGSKQYPWLTKCWAETEAGRRDPEALEHWSACDETRAAMERMAMEIAKEHGWIEPDPRKPSPATAAPALAENTVPFPTWDVNATAAEETASFWTDNLRVSNDEGMAVLRRGKEALFAEYVSVETIARNYLAAHWNKYPNDARDVCLKHKYLAASYVDSWYGLEICLDPTAAVAQAEKMKEEEK